MKKASLAQFGKTLDVYGTPENIKQFHALQSLQRLKDLTSQHIKKKMQLTKKNRKMLEQLETIYNILSLQEKYFCLTTS